MGIGVIFIFIGLICLLEPKTQWFKERIKRHNYSTTYCEVYLFFRNIIGVFFIFIGVVEFIIN